MGQDLIHRQISRLKGAEAQPPRAMDNMTDCLVGTALLHWTLRLSDLPQQKASVWNDSSVQTKPYGHRLPQKTGYWPRRVTGSAQSPHFTQWVLMTLCLCYTPTLPNHLPHGTPPPVCISCTSSQRGSSKEDRSYQTFTEGHLRKDFLSYFSCPEARLAGMNHSITEQLRLEGSSGDDLVQPPCSKQDQLQQVAQGPVQSASENLQGCLHVHPH